MIKRLSTPALMGVLAAALLLTPTRASSAQFFLFPGFGLGGYGGYGGFGGFGGWGGYGGFGYGGFGGWGGGYGGYGGGFGGWGGGYGGYGGYGGGYGGYGGGGYRIPLNYSATPFNIYAALPPTFGYPGRLSNPGYLLSVNGMANNSTNPPMIGYWAVPSVDMTPRMRPSQGSAVRIPASVLLSANKNRPAHIEVHLPTANAEVLVQGTPTTQTGRLREFVSPPLAPGTYTYTIHAIWIAQGQIRRQTRTVSVSPGQLQQVDFTTAP